MKNVKLYITSLLISASMLNIGCVSTVSDHARSAYRNVKRGLQTSPGSAETDALYAQVRSEDQRRVEQLRHELEVAEQTRELSKLEKERDSLKRERSDINSKRSELIAKEKQHKIELAKLEAIDRNQLGDKITNIEQIADTHVDTLEIQQKRLKLDGEIGVLDVKIEQIQTAIEKQQAVINNLTNNDTKTRERITNNSSASKNNS
jgi:chromosome segregation ATPase